MLRPHRFDTVPSILEHPLSQRDDSKEPQAKRSKSEDVSNIATRVAANAYSSLEDVVSDVKSASKLLVELLQLPNGSIRSQYMPLSSRESQLATHIDLFTKKAEDLVQRQKAQDGMKSSVEQPGKVENASSFLMNGTSSSGTAKNITPDLGDGKLVLTLYGNAPNPKQLFSSLQETVKTPNGTVKVPQPLREVALPNGINTTHIVPMNSSLAVDDKKRVQTLGELFSTSTSSLPFQPPKPSRISPSKGSAVGWTQPSVSENVRSRNNQSYNNQRISTGQWLEYNGISDQADPKRKQRNRALSLSGIKTSLSDAESAEQEAAKLEALFRSAYSSFAPTKDDTAAVIPESVINKMWWQRVGEKTFERLANNMESIGLLDIGISKTNNTDEKSLESVDDEDTKFKDAVDHWDEVIDPSLQDSASDANAKSLEEKDVNEVLEGISELLETLNSYQRNRNLALTAVPRSTGVLSGSDTSSPSKPTEAETATYNILKSQLTLMIATLPPYAVAKLNSDQLSHLNISTRIPVLMDTYKGVLEEDEYAARAKVAAMSTAASSRHIPAASHHRTSSSSLYGNQYASSSRPAAPPAQYYPQAQTPVRTPSTNMPRAPSTVGPVPYAAPRPISGTNYRPQQPYATPTYPHQVPRAAPPQQYAGAPQAYYSTPTAPKFAQLPNMPQTAPQPVRYQLPGPGPPYQAQAQGRPAQAPNGMAYAYSNGNATPIARQPSPQKPPQGQPQGYPSHLAAPQQRSYGAPTQAIPQNYYGGMPNGVPMPITPQGMHQQPQQQQQQQPQPQQGLPTGNVSALGPTGYHTVMTPAEQSGLMERQRAQLAQQQGVQVQARNAAQAGAGALGSPAKQPQPQPQLQSQSQVNGGAPM